MAEVLRIEDLHVSFDTYAGEVRSFRGVSCLLYTSRCV